MSPTGTSEPTEFLFSLATAERIFSIVMYFLHIVLNIFGLHAEEGFANHRSVCRNVFQLMALSMQCYACVTQFFCTPFPPAIRNGHHILVHYPGKSRALLRPLGYL